MEIIKKYKTDDGKIFDSEEKALEHEKILDDNNWKTIIHLFYEYGIIDYENGEDFNKMFKPVDINKWEHPWHTIPFNKKSAKAREYSKLLNLPYLWIEYMFIWNLIDAYSFSEEVQYCYANVIDGLNAVANERKRERKNLRSIKKEG